MNWQDYGIEDKSDIQLLSDFRLIVEEYSKVKSGKESELKSEENIISIAMSMIKTVLDRRQVTFELDEISVNTKELLGEVLFAKINQAIIIPAPLSEAVWLGKVKSIQPCLDFKILKSDKIAYGFIRTRESGEIREFIPFNRPFLIDSKSISESKMPLDWNISKLDDTELKALHSDCHDRARWGWIEKRVPPEKYVVNEHSYIVKEMTARKIEHEVMVELDRMTEQAGSINKNVFLSDIMRKWEGGYEFEMPLLYLSGKCCLSGLDNEVVVNVNWNELDGKTIDKIFEAFKNRLPEKYRDKIKYEFDKAGDKEELFVPIAKMKVEIIPVSERKLIRAKRGSFKMQRIKNAGN